MFLAGILALWMLSAIPCPGCTNGAAASAADENLASPDQQPSSQTPADTQAAPAQQAPSSADKSTPAPKHKHKKKAAAPPADASTAPPKKVVPQGSTGDSTTHLSPSMSDEQSAKKKEANTDLTNQTTANLQKVNGRTLTAEQQETADQIRKFLEQAKAADQEGDLERAGTLANKAKLLSDSLEETTRPK